MRCDHSTHHSNNWSTDSNGKIKASSDRLAAAGRSLGPDKAPAAARKTTRHPGWPAVPFRKVLDGILYVLRTGCQGTPLIQPTQPGLLWRSWQLRPSRDSGGKAVPKEFGSDSTCHKRFQQWQRTGVFAQLWEKLVERYDELHGIKWHFQSLDSITIKAPLGGQRRVRTPRIVVRQSSPP